MRENNSAGFYALHTSDYTNLYKHGFKRVYTHCIEIRILAMSECHAVENAIALFENVTGYNSSTCYCETCGNNFYFTVELTPVCDSCGNLLSRMEENANTGYCQECYNSNN